MTLVIKAAKGTKKEGLGKRGWQAGVLSPSGATQEAVMGLAFQFVLTAPPDSGGMGKPSIVYNRMQHQFES